MSSRSRSMRAFIGVDAPHATRIHYGAARPNRAPARRRWSGVRSWPGSRWRRRRVPHERQLEAPHRAPVTPRLARLTQIIAQATHDTVCRLAISPLPDQMTSGMDEPIYIQGVQETRRSDRVTPGWARGQPSGSKMSDRHSKQPCRIEGMAFSPGRNQEGLAGWS
jgi:hypothetical protein